MNQKVIKVCVHGPVWQAYDYLLPDSMDTQSCQPGMRVRVPFGHGSRLGLVWGNAFQNPKPTSKYKLKAIEALLDTEPLLTPSLLTLYQWVSDYYHYPLGEVIFNTLPKLIRQGKSIALPQPERYRINPAMQSTSETLLKRAKKQLQLYQFVLEHKQGTSKSLLLQQGFTSQQLKALLDKELIELFIFKDEDNDSSLIQNYSVNLTEHQQQAVTLINATHDFHTFLLAGVTGSGKTEVYLQTIEQVVQNDKQALVLVPEISLTPQTLERFSKRFNAPIAVMHSGLNDTERAHAWLQAQNGQAKIVIGTRSAVFVPMQNLGIIILDEEHDQSFKQQSGLRYSARDVAIKRAQLESLPVVLGSATPSVESIFNINHKRFTKLELPNRISTAAPPKIELVDLRNQSLQAGLSPQLLSKIKSHLAQKGQVLLFLNRRGYAPVLMCHACGWTAQCQHCDARMTWHEARRRLICHHCCSETFSTRICPHCKQEELNKIGVGTQRLETTLSECFPDKNIVRIDRDSTRKKGALADLLETIHDQNADIIVGTQMIAKGHHFSNLTLVAIVDADAGLFSSDFRALERMGQLFVQVSGRAGRESRQGEVVIQTHQPENPLLQLLLKEGYFKFVDQLMQEREVMSLPPYSAMALFRAEAAQQQKSQQFLETVKDLTGPLQSSVQVMGPIAAPMQKKAGMYRSQLLLRAKTRKELHSFMSALMPKITALKESKRLRWSLDIDPQEMF